MSVVLYSTVGPNVLLLVFYVVCMPCSHCCHAAHCTYGCGDAMLVQGTLPSFLFTLYSHTIFSTRVSQQTRDGVFDVVNPRFGLLSLEREEVITQDVVSHISAVNDDDAKEILFAHLTNYANVNAVTLMKYCDIIIGANVFPNMQSFGVRMKEQLQQGGWLS